MLKNRLKEKTCQQMSFTYCFWKVSSPNGLSVLLANIRQKKESKNHAACVLVICCLTHVINGKVIEDEAIYNFWRFLVEDFFSVAGYKTARNLL